MTDQQQAEAPADNVVSMTRTTVADEIKTQLRNVAAQATTEEKQKVTDLIKTATTAVRKSEVFRFTPAMAALVFLNHNPFNRDWRPAGEGKTCQEYARRMKEGLWKWNNSSIGFYQDGSLADGQHRLSGSALAGYTLETDVVFGIARDAIVTVDDGLTRHGADHAKLHGITDARQKQAVVKMAAAYMVKSGDKNAKLRSEAEIHQMIAQRNHVLDLAIEIGEASVQGRVNFVLKPTPAFALAYLLLTHHWPEVRVREKLAMFQSGQYSTTSESDPYFVASKIITDARKKREVRDRLNTAKELGVAMCAMIESERGVKAISATAIRNVVKSVLPSPEFPAQEAAA